MATGCCKGTVSWFCCYPDSCGCDGCCCQGNDCSAGCSSTSTCGVGACCTCNSGNWGYAWPCCGCCEGGAGYAWCPSCGHDLCFSTDCFGYYEASRVDTGPATNLGRIADFTKSMFQNFAPLSQGLIYNMRAVGCTDLPCC